MDNSNDPTVQAILAEQEQALSEIKKQFHQTTFMERMNILFTGLNAPKDSREYKLARIEVQRLTAPALAIVIPCVTVGAIVLFASNQAPRATEFSVEIQEVEEVQPLDKPEEIKPVDNDIPECDFEFDIDVPVPLDQPIMDTVTAQPAEFDAVAITKSPVVIKGIYASRNPGSRGSMVGRYSKNRHGNEEAVSITLRWLKKNQNQDGSWPRHKPAMTGLALACFLAHGETGESPEFGHTVVKAIEYLVYSYKNSRWEGSDGHEYSFPIALYSLCEAYGMTGNPNIRPVAEDALKRLINGQHPSGGWDYNMGPGDRDDTSYMAWCAQALKAAQMAKMFSNDTEWKSKLDRAAKLSNNGFIKNSGQSGGFGYTEPGNSGFNGLGVLCMQFHGAANTPQARNTLSLMDAWVPGWFATEAEWKASGMPGGIIHGHTGCPQYYYYYATQAKFHDGDKRFKPWYEKIDAEYQKAQKVEKAAFPDHNGVMKDIGWWENPDQHTDNRGGLPVMDTCLAALQLMTPYRHMPTTTAAAVKIDAEILEAVATDKKDVTLDIGNL